MPVRHALAYLNRQSGATDRGTSSTIRLRRDHSHDEINNWRAAVQWTLIERGDVPLGQRLVGWISSAWAGYIVNEVRRWIVMASELVDEQRP